MLVVGAKGRTNSVTSGVFRNSYTREVRDAGVSRVEGFVLGRSVKVDFDGGNDANRETRVE